MGVLLSIALYFQFTAKKYVPWAYWLTVVLISVFDALDTDNLTDHHGVLLETSTNVFRVLLIGIFIAWYLCEGTLSVHSIVSRRREVFYWLTILFTFTLGMIAGLTVVGARFLVPPATLEAVVTRFLGQSGLVGLLIVSYLLAALLAYIFAKKFIVPCLVK